MGWLECRSVFVMSDVKEVFFKLGEGLKLPSAQFDWDCTLGRRAGW